MKARKAGRSTQSDGLMRLYELAGATVDRGSGSVTLSGDGAVTPVEIILRVVPGEIRFQDGLMEVSLVVLIDDEDWIEPVPNPARPFGPPDHKIHAREYMATITMPPNQIRFLADQ